LSPVSTGMGDRLRAGIPPWYVTKPTRSTQPCIPLGSLNRVPALIGWCKGGNVASAGWQVTLCDPIRHVSSRSGEACCELLYPVTLLLLGCCSLAGQNTASHSVVYRCGRCKYLFVTGSETSHWMNIIFSNCFE